MEPTRRPPLNIVGLAALALLMLSAAQAPAYAATTVAGPTGAVNDTGQTLCSDGAATPSMVPCTAANTGDTSPLPRQDGRFGRDPKAASGTLTKVGGGVAGFDFTKVCQDGTLGCTSAVDQTATPAASAWACTKDNVTNLIWAQEIFISSWTSDVASTIPAKIVSTNAANRCGYNSGWRLPTQGELLSIALYDGSNPAIDAAYFPYTPANWFWSSDVYVPFPIYAWIVDFNGGFTISVYLADPHNVRLVRSGL